MVGLPIIIVIIRTMVGKIIVLNRIINRLVVGEIVVIGVGLVQIAIGWE